MTPPVTPSGLNALTNIDSIAAGISLKFTPSTNSAAATYSSAIKGTSLEVTRAMLLMPPMMTKPVTTARISPKTQPRSAKKLASPPVTLTNCT